MIHGPVLRAINDARQKLHVANDQAQEADVSPLHDAFEALRLAVGDLADAVESLYEASTLEEQGR